MISGPVVVDASVVVEFLVDLGLAPAASRLFRRLLEPDSDFELWAPDLVHLEVASAIRKLVMRRRLRTEAGAQAIARVARLPIRTTSSAPLLPEIWKLRASLTAYDACYVALGRKLSCPLITADHRLVRAMARSKDRVIALESLPV